MNFCKRLSFVLALLALVLATVACSTAQNVQTQAIPGSGQSIQSPAATGGHVSAPTAKQSPATAAITAPRAVPEAVIASEAQKKMAVRPFVKPEEPRRSVASSMDGEEEFKTSPVGASEQLAPGEGITSYDQVIVGPDGPDISELDPAIPLNMKKPMPEWKKQADKALREQYSGITVTPDPTNGPIIDLADPNTPPSSLLPAPNGTEAIHDRALGSFGSISFQSFPAATVYGGPPDVSLTVGKDYVIAGYNSYYAVYNKVTGAQAAAFNMTTLFSGVGSICSAGYAICDPVVLYDDFNGGSCPNPTDPRYILIALAYNSAYDGALCVAVSKSGLAPTSVANFHRFEFNPLAATAGLPDYPKAAVGPDALIIGHNWFPSAGGGGYGYGAALSKTNLYNGTTPTTREFNFGTPLRTPWPAVRVGCKQSQIPTYNGTHLTLYNASTTALTLYRWPVPATSNNPVVYTMPSTLAATSCTNPTGAYITDYNIDCFPAQWQDAEQRGDLLFTTRSASGGGGSAIQWAKINVGGSAPVVHSSGTIFETGNYLWMPSIASDRSYDFGLAFSKASQTNSIRVSGAVAGSEGGTWGGVLTAKAGEVVYNGGVDQNGSYRWGDYSGFAPDPEDGCTLWSNTQYAKNGVAIDDASWIATYRFSACSSDPQAFLDRTQYTCFQAVSGSIIDMTGAPTNAVYHSTTGGAYPAAISGGPNNYTVAPVTVAQLGAADGDDIWLTFTAGDAVEYSSSLSKVVCVVNVCVTRVDDLGGGCDGDTYMDRGETLNVFVQFTNNETFALPTGFTADLRVDPAFPDANVIIVTPTAEWPALDVAESSYAVGVPFQVRNTGGTDIRTVHFQVYNIRAVDDSWTSTCTTGATFTRIANANNEVGASFGGFPESFDVAVPPTGWAQTDVVGTVLNWARATATVHPAGFPTHSGTGLAHANCWDSSASIGTEVRLHRDTDTDASAYPLVGVSFWMFHDTQYSTYLDSLRLQVSIDSGASWSDVGPVYQRTQLYGGANNSWVQHVVDASDVAGGQAAVRIGLVAHSEYGNNIHIDDVDFVQINRVADTSTCPGAPVLALSSNYQGYGYGYYLWDEQCNFNSYPDANETGTMLFYLTNSGNENAYGVTATLTCPDCPAGVTICDDTATYGDIPYGSGYVFAAAEDGFRVSLSGAVADGTVLPWILTVNTTNTPAYGTTITVPPGGQADPDHYFKSWSGTPTLVDNGDPSGYSYADYFEIAPRTAGATGRYGFDTAWTGTANVTLATSTTDPLGIGTVAQIAGTTEQTMAHAFSTAGIDTDVSAYWIFNYGRAAAASRFFFEWSNNGGTTWLNFLPGGTGLAGAAAGQDAWVSYGYNSLYSIAYNSTNSAYGPVVANQMLNNPNFMVRFRVTGGTTTTYWQISPFWMDHTAYLNEATACTGSCLPPVASVISEVRDVDPCAQSGVKVFFEEGMGTVSTNLRRDNVNVVTGYASGTTYDPGDSASHSYVIRGINADGYTDSAAMAGTDFTAPAWTPSIACEPASCTGAPTIGLATESGYTNYQWLLEGAPIPGANTDTYTATLVGNYTVSYKKGACTYTSAPKSVTPTTQPVLEVNSVTLQGQVCGDGDAYVEPGEQWTVRVQLINTGNAAATNAVAGLALNLGSEKPVSISGNPGAFGAIAIGGTAFVDFMIEVDSAIDCPKNIILDVTGIACDGYAFPSEVPAFTQGVGANFNESGTANPGAAMNNAQTAAYAPAFTLASATTGTVDYSFTYAPNPGSQDLITDDFANLNNWTYSAGISILADSAHCSHSNNVALIDRGDNMYLSADLDTTGYTSVQVIFDWTVIGFDTATDDELILEVSTNGGGAWTQVWSDGNTIGNPAYTCGQTVDVSAYASTQFRIQFRVASNNNADDAKVDYVIVRGTAPAGGTWNANARTELLAPDGTPYILKDYGTSETSPASHNVAAIYNSEGAGAYTLRVTENFGGTADVTSSTMSVTLVQCNYTNCSGTTTPPPPVYNSDSGGAAARFWKGAGDDISVTYDASTCTGTKAIIVYGNLSDWSGYAGCAQADGGNAGNTTIVSTGQTDVWYNILWTSDTTAGHPGFSSSGARTWTVGAGVCGMAANDHTDSICN